MRLSLLPLTLWTTTTCAVVAFAPTPLTLSRRAAVGPLGAIIYPDEPEEEGVDPRAGGVGITEDSAIKIVGAVRYAPGKSTTAVRGLARYTNVRELSESNVKEMLAKHGGKIIATGSGKEWYKDPGETTEKFVQYAPIEAAKDAAADADSVAGVTNLVYNFLGGDDLMFDEVREATKLLSNNLSPPTKTGISYNSLCYQTFPLEKACVAVISRGPEVAEGLTGEEKSIASGEVYFSEGKWWTVVEEDITLEE